MSEFIANWAVWIVCGVIALAAFGFFSCKKSDGGKPPEAQPASPTTPAVQGVEAKLDTGLRSHDVVLTHRHNDKGAPGDSRLTDVEVTLVLYKEDGTRHEVKRVWAAWDKGEAKKVNVPAHKYQKVELIGTCTAADSVGFLGKHNIQITWLWNWDRK